MMDDNTTLWYIVTCRCTRMMHTTNYKALMVKYDCPRCKGEGYRYFADREIWKYDGISIA